MPRNRARTLAQRSLVVLGAAAVSGLLLILSLPPRDAHWLAGFALVPALLAVRRTRFLIGFACGLLVSGAALGVVALGWFSPYDVPGPLDWAATGLLIFGVTMAVTFGVFAELRRLGRWGAWVLAAVPVLVEGLSLLELPVHFALTQYRAPGFLFLSSVAGIWATSYVLWGINLACVRAIASRKAPLLVGTGIAYAVLFLFSTLVRAPERWDGGGLRVGVVQTTSDDLERLSELARRTGAELVVLPELSGQRASAGGDTAALRAMAAAAGQPAFVTTFEDGAHPPRNVAALFAASFESPRYAKRKLFGRERLERQPGDRAVAVEFRGVRVGLNICYDSCYPSVMRDSVLSAGAQVIALPTLDPPSRDAFVESVHAAYTPFRAAELGVPIVRADSHAVSMIVDGTGRILTEVGVGDDRTGAASVFPRTGWTLYARTGDWFLGLCGAVVVGWISRRMWLRIRGVRGGEGLALQGEEVPVVRLHAPRRTRRHRN
jgi:apolipoprotein N-acyltransferase